MRSGGRSRIELIVGLALAFAGVFASTSGAQTIQSRGIYVPLPDMATARQRPAVAVLPEGAALVAGGAGYVGIGSGPRLRTTEIFDGRTRTFHSGPSMEKGRSSAVAIPLPGGRALIAGGAGDSSSEIFDPASNSFSPGPEMTSVRSDPAVVGLGNGRFLIAGGAGEVAPLADSEIFDTQTMAFTEGPPMSTAHHRAIALALPDGRVLIAGGFDASWQVSSATDLYDLSTGRFTPGPPLPGPFVGQSMPLADNTALLPMSGTIFDPKTFKYSPGSSYPGEAWSGGYGIGVFDDGRILLAGGARGHLHGSTAFSSAYLYEADGAFKVRRTRRFLIARVHAAGALTVKGPGLKRVRRHGGPGDIRVPLRRKAHAGAGRARIRVKIRFAPLGGSPSVKTKRLRFT